jgi:hypothetical protein
MARPARRDVRRQAAVFVGPDEPTVSEESALSRLVFVGSSCTELAAGAGARCARAIFLEIGGANIASVDRALSIRVSAATTPEKRDDLSCSMLEQ